MNTDEFLAELAIINHHLNKISNAIASPDGITQNPSYGYLKDKMEGTRNTADHIIGQIRNKVKEERMGNRTKH
jgi:hypothetical protein